MQNRNPGVPYEARRAKEGGVTEAAASSLPNEPPIVFDLVSFKKCQELFF